MSARYDLYQPGRSWLHRLDPRCKMLGVACASALLLSWRNLWLIGGWLALAQVALVSAGVRRERLAWVWRMTLPTMVMIAALWVLAYPGQGPALIAFWRVRVTVGNLAQGAAMALRIAALAFTAFLWLFSTDQATLVRGLVALGMPYPWGLTLAMALRYLPTLAGVFRMIVEAQQARALDLSGRNPFQRARAYLPITVAMLISALRTADGLSRALESRALGAAPRRTYLRELHFTRADLVWAIGLALATATLLYARAAWGLGANPL